MADRARIRHVGERDGDPSYQDLYFFGYGLRFTEAIDDFYRLTGPTPLIPRWALGNWWSRFYRYSQNEYLELMRRFKNVGIPFSVSVIDMDWHITDVDPKFGSGWTGYSWNRELFPDHRQFLRELHREGLRVTLNEHPRDGIRAFEDDYAHVARNMGVDPDSQAPIMFDPSSPRFMDAYLDLHHRMAREGVDFWWVDWQQGGVTRQKGLDPLWMLNHTHYLDSRDCAQSSAQNAQNNAYVSAHNNTQNNSQNNVQNSAHSTVPANTEQPRPWPLTFSRYAGPGSHRYPIGFSGDTVMTWESLDFQPRFTATASNIGYGWWSHDIGGHMLGYRDNELELRWYQYGVFSPINRLHSSNSPFSGKEPWNFPEPMRSQMIRALRLRHELLPYVYTMNYRAAFGNRPLIEPMYWRSPHEPTAYWYPNEYYFGTQLIVAPITRAVDPHTLRARADLWLPQGEYYDFFEGRRYVSADAGGRRLTVWRGLDRTPVFAQSGAIVPLQILEDGAAVNSVDNPARLRVLAFPGSGEFEMIEDSGEWSAALRATARTRLSQQWGEDATVFTVSAVEGDAVAVPAVRDWTIVFRGVARPDAEQAQSLQVFVDGHSAVATMHYDESTLSLSVTVAAVSASAPVEIRFAKPLGIASNPALEDCRQILLESQMSNVGKDLAWEAINRQGAAALASMPALDVQPGAHDPILTSHVPQSVIAALTEPLLRS